MKKGKWGYWSDLHALQFDDSGNTAIWIQGMPLGTYSHPVHGDIAITPERVQQFAASVKSKVRGQDLDVDYDHKEYGGEAAGWIQDAEARNDGLWLLVNWTKKAYEQLKDKAYRYFSPEFSDEWIHPKTNQKHQNVLFGGAITNRPFLKDILPINMSEIFAKEGATPPPPAPTIDPVQGGGSMDPKLLRILLQLKEDATDAEVATKLAELVARSGAPAKDPTPTPAPTDPFKLDINNPQSVTDALKQLTDVQGNPAIKALTDLVEAQGSQLKKFDRERRELLVTQKLNSLDESKKFAVPPTVKDQLRDIMLNSPDGLGEQVFQAYKSTLEIGIIDMTESGWQRRGGDTSPTTQFLTAVDEKMASNKSLSYADAAMAVSRENPKLALSYREDSYIPSEGR